MFSSKSLLTLSVSFHCSHSVLRLHGGGREKKRPKSNVSSSHCFVPDGDDPMDSDFNIEEERGSKKIARHMRKSKNASNVSISHQPSPHKCHRNPSPSSPSSSSTSQPLSSSGGDGDDSDDDEEEEEHNEEEEEEAGSADEGLEYNSRAVVRPIDVMSTPRNSKDWGRLSSGISMKLVT